MYCVSFGYLDMCSKLADNWRILVKRSNVSGMIVVLQPRPLNILQYIYCPSLIIITSSQKQILISETCSRAFFQCLITWGTELYGNFDIDPMGRIHQIYGTETIDSAMKIWLWAVGILQVKSDTDSASSLHILRRESSVWDKKLRNCERSSSYWLPLTAVGNKMKYEFYYSFDFDRKFAQRLHVRGDAQRDFRRCATTMSLSKRSWKKTLWFLIWGLRFRVSADGPPPRLWTRRLRILIIISPLNHDHQRLWPSSFQSTLFIVPC